MPPKGISKAVNKRCSECQKQIPVATRLCHCGHQFFEERRKSTASNNSELDDIEELGGHDIKELKLVRMGSVEGSKQMGSSSTPAVEVKRRSERVKREKPNYYDSLEYDNQMRKARKERQREEQLHSGSRIKRERKIKTCSEPEDDDEDDLLRERRGRKKKKSISLDRKDDEIDEDIMTGITPEKEWQYSVVLSDINMKLGFNNPTFDIVT